MGQSESSPFSNSNNINELIENDQWQTADGVFFDIDLNSDGSENPFKHKYIIKIDSEIPHNCRMAVLFPNHSNYKKRVLWTSGHLNHLNTEINSRITESAREGILLYVSCSDKIYRFKNVIGNVYIAWASRLNIQTPLYREENDIKVHVPILIETNGQWENRNVYIFGKDDLVHLKDVQMHEPIETNIYCCEKDPRKEFIRIVPTLTEDQSDQITKDPVVRTLVCFEKEEKSPFSGEELELLVTTDRTTNYTFARDPGLPDEGGEN